MAGNNAPIFSRVGDIQGGITLTTAAADYTGQGINNAVVFNADSTNGSFVQRLRFKSSGTNVATVARVYINNGSMRLVSPLAANSTPVGTPSTSGGTLTSGTYFAKIVSGDQYGGYNNPSVESTSVTVVGPVGSISWAWTGTNAATSYRVYVGPVAGGQASYFSTSTNLFVQTTAVGLRDTLNGVQNNNQFYGEVSLPATTAVANAATVEVDYPINVALPPSYRLLVGLGTTVVAGWQISTIGGDY
jgi:hypothetical protein